LRRSRLRAWLQRFDHAAIFAMIAATYTPFTMLRLDGVWATGLTGTIWSIAGIGIGAKLLQPRWIERISLALYLMLGWIGLVAIGPFMQAMDGPTLGLLGAGGALYTSGVIFHVWRALPYHTAIWHGFVLVAAGLHYGAVLSMMLAG
jgi:hemolysin III